MAITYLRDITAPRPRGHYDFSHPTQKCIQHCAGDVAYVGQVVAINIRRQVQVMSDMWQDQFLAKIATPEGFTLVVTGSEATRTAEARVDVDPVLLAQAEAADARAKAEKARIKRERVRAERNEEAKRELIHRISKGDRVVVARGRKVPKGTEGVVIWEGVNSYGHRVGVKDDAGTVHWTARSNVERTAAEVTALTVLANGDWDRLRMERRNAAAVAREAKRAAAPTKGTKVKTACGYVGKVFWVSDDGERLGVRHGEAREDVVWVNANAVAAV